VADGAGTVTRRERSAPPEPSDEELTAAPPRSVGRRILSGLLTYGVVLFAFWYLVNNTSADWAPALSLITPTMVVVSVALGLVVLATHWPPTAIALPGLRMRESAVTNTASAALTNTVPEGGAVGTGLNYAMMRSWGFGLGDITSEVLVTGTWSQLMKYLLLAVGLTAVSLQGWGPPATPWAALVLVVLVALALLVLAAILRSQSFAEHLGRWIDALVARVRRHISRIPEPGFTESVPTFRTVMVGLLRQCWARLTVAELVTQLAAVLTLGIACRMQGLTESVVSWAVILTAWGLVTFASLLIPTPGGMGVAEVVLVGVLGYDLAQSEQPAVLAAVLLYRIATFLVPIPVGLGTYVYWRKSKAWRRPPGTRGPMALSTSGAAPEP
jgi:uncharacterized membrane protein YbhN (UPF0104 family)